MSRKRTASDGRRARLKAEARGPPWSGPAGLGGALIAVGASKADEIREFSRARYVEPARSARKDRFEIRAGDVHREMRLASSHPSVCGALGSNKFLDLCGLDLVERRGPAQGANAVFVYRFRDAGRPPTKPPTAPQPDLQRMRTEIVRILNRLEGVPTAREDLGDRVGRLARAGGIPGTTSKFMSVILKLRNDVEYRERKLEPYEYEQANAAWTAIQAWAGSAGLLS